MFSYRAVFVPEKDIPDLEGKVIIVTGGNIGLGLETVRQLAKHNPKRIYLAARSKEKGEAAIKGLRDSNPDSAPISLLNLDLSSFESIKSAATTFQNSESRLDILINNAGIMMNPEGLTKEGYEIQFGTNHVGHALFTQLLLPTLQHTSTTNPETRVVNLSSGADRFAPSDIYKPGELKTTMSNRSTDSRYAISKVANIHYTLALAERYKGIKFIAVHPGVVATNLLNDIHGCFRKAAMSTIAGLLATPVEKGALNQIWAAVSPNVESGGCYAPVGLPWIPSKISQNNDLQEQLWNWTQNELKVHLQM